MKTISSIGNRGWSLLLTLFFACNAPGSTLSETTNFANSQYQISSSCNESQKSDNCSIYLIEKGEKKEIIEYPLPPSSIRLERDTFVIIFPCGTQCSATYFYAPGKGLSGPYPLVVNYDLQSGLALSVAKNPVQIYRLFQSERKTLAGRVVLDLPRGSKFDPGSVWQSWDNVEAYIKDVTTFAVGGAPANEGVLTLAFPAPQSSSQCFDNRVRIGIAATKDHPQALVNRGIYGAVQIWEYIRLYMQAGASTLLPGSARRPYRITRASEALRILNPLQVLKVQHPASSMVALRSSIFSHHCFTDRTASDVKRHSVYVS